MIANGSKVVVRSDLIDGIASEVGFLEEMKAYPIVTIKDSNVSRLGFVYYRVYENEYTYTEEFFTIFKERKSPNSIPLDVNEDRAKVVTQAFGNDKAEIRSFATGAVRDTSEGKPPMELMPWDLMDRLANHYGKGATKFGVNNWRLGQPKTAVFASMMRHLIKYFMGMEDEDHLAAFVWGGFNLMHTDKYYSTDKYLNDLQSYKDNIKED